MTSWNELAADLPANANMATGKWQAWVLQQFADGNTPPIEWWPVKTRHGNLTATFRVTNRARLGDEFDSVLPITSADTAQRILDLTDSVAVTPLLYDAIANQGFLISYVSLGNRDVTNLTAAQMVANSREIDQRLELHEYGLWEVGKSSVVTARYNNPGEPGRTGPTGLRNGWDTMINYGAALLGPAGAGNRNPWPSVTLPTILRVWQPPGGTGKLWHHLAHADISQKAPHRVHRDVLVQGPETQATVDIEDLASDPDTAPLVSSMGPLSSMRIPIDGKEFQPPTPNGGTPDPTVAKTPTGTIVAGAGVAMAIAFFFYVMS